MKDALGKELKIGDKVAYARLGINSVLEFEECMVIDFHEKKIGIKTSQDKVPHLHTHVYSKSIVKLES